MNPRTEERLRAAFEAKADQVTEERLDRLAARRQQALLDGADWSDVEVPAGLALFDDSLEAGDLTPLDLDHRGGTRHARWLAPVLAVAAVAAVALGVTAISTVVHDSKRVSNPPATQVTSPSPSASPSVPTSVPAPAPTPATAVVTPPYLPRGQQGFRSQVPWSAVGTGWRLLLPYDAGDTPPASLYLYDPAGGRYLISDRLPAHASLLAWSPDGTRAMVRSSSSGDTTRYQEVSLRSGELSTGFTSRSNSFVSYTQPKGLAVLIREIVNGTERLVRYSTTGHVLHSYAPDLAGHGRLDATNALYLPHGGQFVAAISQGPLVLISNAGDFVRAYPLPKGYQSCAPVKWWTDTVVLERCGRLTELSGVDALYLQPVSGGSLTVLTTGAGQYQMGYSDAWPLSNGHMLLQNTVGCGSGSYDILLGNGGATRPLRMPAGLATDTPILHIDADLVTFAQRVITGCVLQGDPHYVLIDYNLVTGAIGKLRDGAASMASWPGIKS
jgi:hypothetical protein